MHQVVKLALALCLAIFLFSAVYIPRGITDPLPMSAVLLPIERDGAIVHSATVGWGDWEPARGNAYLVLHNRGEARDGAALLRWRLRHAGTEVSAMPRVLGQQPEKDGWITRGHLDDSWIALGKILVDRTARLDLEIDVPTSARLKEGDLLLGLEGEYDGDLRESRSVTRFLVMLLCGLGVAISGGGLALASLARKP